MNRFRNRTIRRAGGAVLTTGLLAAICVLPAAAERPSASPSATGSKAEDQTKPPPPQPTFTNDQLVLADLDLSGLPSKAQLINRVTTVDRPTQTIAQHSAISDVRYVDRPGAPKTQANTVLLPIGGSGTSSVTTQATFSKPLPVALHAEYIRDGQAVNPKTLTGLGGTITIRYTATNTVVEDKAISYRDAEGELTTETQPVFAPFAGVIRAVLPAGSELVSAPEAVVNTIADGQTELLWNLVLYPPMGSYQQTVELVMSSPDIQLPDLQAEITPVIPEQAPFADFAANMLSQSVKGNTELAEGLETLDKSTAQLAEGTAGLAKGLIELHQGANQLAKGEKALASGSGKAHRGSRELTNAGRSLATGLTQLAVGLDQMAGASGLPAAVSGTQSLADAVNEIVARVGSKNDPPIPWPPNPDAITLIQATRATLEGAQLLKTKAAGLSSEQSQVTGIGTDAASLATDAATAKAAADAAYAPVCGSGGTDPGNVLCVHLDAAAIALGSAETEAKDIETQAGETADSLAAKRLILTGGLEAMSIALQKITEGLETLSAALKSSEPGATSVYGGLIELKEALSAAASGAAELAAGADSAESGADKVANGQAALTTALGSMTSGANTLAVGATKLDQGLAEAATGGGELSKGASELQKKGTSQILDQVVTASKEPAMADAYLQAVQTMTGAAATPYDPPPDATGRVAYVYSLKAPSPSDSVDWPLLLLGVLGAISLLTLAIIRIRRPAGQRPPTG